LQCVATCCSVLQSVAVCCSVLQCVATCCSVLQCVAMCCSVLHINSDHYECTCVVVCCSALQCTALCSSVLQCVAVCCSVLHLNGDHWDCACVSTQSPHPPPVHATRQLTRALPPPERACICVRVCVFERESLCERETGQTDPVYVCVCWEGGGKCVCSILRVELRGGGLGSSTISKNLMSPTPRRKWYLTTGRRAH